MFVRMSVKNTIKLAGALGVIGASLVGLQASVAADKPAEPVVAGAPAEMRQLTQAQYLESVAAIFGNDIVAKVRFAPVQRIDGLVAIGSRTAAMSPGALEPVEESARAIALQVVNTPFRERLIPCQPKDIAQRDDACARQFLEKVGHLLYRRGMTEAELGEVINISGDAVGRAGDFYFGLSAGLSRMLMSRQFLYVKENVEPDPANPGQYRLDAISKASRLSLLLWNAIPDSALLAAAESGAIHSDKELKRQVERMLKSPRVEHGLRAFFSDMLSFEGFDILAKDPVIYPAFTSKVVSESREQLLRTMLDHIVTQNADYRDLFTSRKTFMTRDLAAVYRVAVNVAPDGWVPYEFPEGDPRTGLLTQVGFLAKYSHPGRTSPTQRGRGLREAFLCQKVPDPPANVDFSLLEDPTVKLRTARERLDAHSTNPVCAGCHKLTDPIGLVLENFDGAGQYRTEEKEVAIDTSGMFENKKIANAAELGAALRGSPALASCLVSRIYSYGTGRRIAAKDKELSQYLNASFEMNGYRVLDFLRTVVTSKAFYAVQPPAAQEARAQ